MSSERSRLTPEDVCGAKPPAVVYTDDAVELMWPQAAAELSGFAQHLDRTQATITAAQMRMAINLANEAAAARKARKAASGQ